MIILEMLNEYLTTPKMEMTTELEMMGLIAIGVIALAILGVICLVWVIGDKVVKYLRKRRGERLFNKVYNKYLKR